MLLRFDPAIRQAAILSDRYAGLDGSALLRAVVTEAYPGRTALVSSFGAEAAVLLRLVAEIDPATPVIFLDTGKHFPETLRYVATVSERLGLRDVRRITPSSQDVAESDIDGGLWRQDPDACCRLRKVLPLERALAGFKAWITGRKRFHGGQRGELPLIEAAGGRIKINPLARWSAEDIRDAFARLDLPPHPLSGSGYRSIGCATCTRAIAPDDDVRAGRWDGSGKTECGIHLQPGGIVRRAG